MGISAAGRGHDSAQELGELACRPGGVGAQVEEMLQIGDQHDLVTVAAAWCAGLRQVLLGAVLAVRRLRA